MSYRTLPGMPAPSSPPVGVTEDGAIAFGLMDEEYQELIPGINPDTGQPDGRFDGHITAAVPLRSEGPVNPTPDPRAPQLLGPRPSDLVIARDLGTGLADLFHDERLRQQADEARRALDPRRLRP